MPDQVEEARFSYSPVTFVNLNKTHNLSDPSVISNTYFRKLPEETINTPHTYGLFFLFKFQEKIVESLTFLSLCL